MRVCPSEHVKNKATGRSKQWGRKVPSKKTQQAKQNRKTQCNGAGKALIAYSSVRDAVCKYCKKKGCWKIVGEINAATKTQQDSVFLGSVLKLTKTRDVETVEILNRYRTWYGCNTYRHGQWGVFWQVQTVKNGPVRTRSDTVACKRKIHSHLLQ